MSEETRGLRTLPVTLLLGFGAWFVILAARLIFLLTVKEPWTAVRFNLITEGTSFACELLALVGAIELARRVSGHAALGVKVAACGFAGAFAVNVSWSFLQFKSNLYEIEWLYKLYDYGYFALWLLVPVGLAIALWREKKELAIFVVVLSLLTWPPPFLAKHLYSWLPSGKSGYVIDMVLRGLRFVSYIGAFAMVARMAAVADSVRAASGLRLSAKALWLRVIAAVVVVMLTLIVIGGKGTQSSFEVLKLAMFSAMIINIIALVQFGIGGLRTACGEVPDLNRWSFAIGGGASLWGAGVMLAQLPWLYRMLYGGSEGSSFMSESATEYTQALSLAMPIVITAGVAVIGVAVAGLASRRANPELSASAQAKCAGFVTLALVSIAIQSWMIPKAMRGASIGSFAMLSLLAAGAFLVAIVMMARLLNQAADELEREPGLPTAQVLSDGT